MFCRQRSQFLTKLTLHCLLAVLVCCCVLQVDDVLLAGTVCLPWACRIIEYAR